MTSREEQGEVEHGVEDRNRQSRAGWGRENNITILEKIYNAG